MKLVWAMEIGRFRVAVSGDPAGGLEVQEEAAAHEWVLRVRGSSDSNFVAGLCGLGLANGLFRYEERLKMKPNPLRCNRQRASKNSTTEKNI